jgi:hypothetical protein
MGLACPTVRGPAARNVFHLAATAHDVATLTLHLAADLCNIWIRQCKITTS